MANIVWAGKQRARAQVGTLTVTSADTGGTITVTVGGTKSVVITPADTNTTNTALQLQTALAASLEGEFSEITWTQATNVVTFTGPADGAPITISKTDGGTNATTLVSAATAALSPNDVNDALNWVGGVPGNADVAVFESGDVDALYNLAVPTAVTFGFLRRASYTGRIGLPDLNSRGYVEYRARRFKYAGVAETIEQSDSDSANQIRLEKTAAGASTINITGNGAPAVGDEPIEITGIASTSVLNVSGAGVVVSPFTADVSTIATIRGNDATITTGPAVTCTTINLTGGNAKLQSTYATLTMDRAANVEVRRAAVGTTTTNDSGTLLWKSTATFGTLVLGSDGVLDLSQAPAAIVPTAITVNSASTIKDPAGRLTKTYSIVFNRCGVQDVSLDLGTNYTAAIS